MIRDGVFVITEVVLDLGTTATDIRSSTVDRPVGTHGSAASAHLMLWENDIHGVLQSTETYVAEAATTVTAMSLAMGDAEAAIDVALTSRQDVNAGFATSAKRVGASVVNSQATDGKYIFLTGDDNADTTLNAGQLVIRFIGMLSSEISVD
jgi:4-hydroxyphenylpyruvate dioxygenase-like putative hemolysin